MRVWKKRICEAALLLLFLFLLVFSLRAAGNLLCSNGENPLNRAGEGLYRQPKGSIDVVYLGPSHVYSSIIPQYIFDEYGITGYDFATAAQSFDSTYWGLREALRLQKPKVAVVELICATADPRERQSAIYYTGLCRMLSPFSPIKHQAAWDLYQKEQQSFQQADLLDEGSAGKLSWTDFWRLTTFHTQYAKLNRQSFDDLWGPPIYEKSRGWSPVFSKKPLPAAPTDAGRPDNLTLSDSTLENLEKMAAAAKRSGTRLVFMVAPYPTSPRENSLYGQLRDWADQHEIDLLDFNLLWEELELDPENDFSDSTHLNYYGARKVSNYMGRYLQDTGLFTDKRTDPHYRSWQQDAHNYELWERAARSPEQQTTEEYAEFLSQLNGDYLALLGGVPDPALSEVLAGAGLDAPAGQLVCGIFNGEHWDLRPGTERMEDNIHGHSLVAAANPDGGHLVLNDQHTTGGPGVIVSVWDQLSGRLVQQVRLTGSGVFPTDQTSG